MTDSSEPSSTKPYFIRAIHEWCSDNGFTPYLAVSVDARTIVPREHVKAGEIVLNVSHGATGRLQMGNDLITFQARFGGVARDLSVPVENVSAIYARENGHGMAFEVPKAPAVVEEPAQGAARAPVQLSLTEGDSSAPSDAAEESSPRPAAVPPSLASVPGAPSSARDDDEAPPDPVPPKGGRPKLTRVK
jgi:stringent starvation protein B